MPGPGNTIQATGFFCQSQFDSLDVIVSGRGKQMIKWMGFSLATAVLLISLTAIAQERGVVKPQLLVSEIVEGMPKGERQQVRILTATFQPGDKTMFHTHRFPVTVYVLEGAFTLEMEGHEPVMVKDGHAMVMPPHVKMTGYNRSRTRPLRLVIFSVSDPDTPFLDPIRPSADN